MARLRIWTRMLHISQARLLCPVVRFFKCQLTDKPANLPKYQSGTNEAGKRHPGEQGRLVNRPYQAHSEEHGVAAVSQVSEPPTQSC